MIEKILIGLGLVIVPFISLPGSEGREQKFIAALIFASALILWVLFRGRVKALRNKWLYILMAYLPIGCLFSPVFFVNAFGVDSSNFWMFKGLVSIFIYFLFIICVCSVKDESEILLKVMYWVGFVMAVYGLIQWSGFEQFFRFSATNEHLNTPGSEIAGTLGHPTLFAPFVAMIIPIAIYFKKWLGAGVMAVAVIAVRSDVGIGAMVISSAVALMTGEKAIKILAVSVLVLCIGLAVFNRSKISNNGRFTLWQNAIADLKTPLEKDGQTFGLTGYGIGSFRYLYNLRHPIDDGMKQFFEPWRSAHNEYIQILYESGAIGLILFVLAFLNFLKDALVFTKRNVCLLSSFLCMALCAGGTFVWQLGPTAYYTAFLVGILSKTEA